MDNWSVVLAASVGTGLYLWERWRGRCPRCRTTWVLVMTTPDLPDEADPPRGCRQFLVVCRVCGFHRGERRPRSYPSAWAAATNATVVAGALAVALAGLLAHGQ